MFSYISGKLAYKGHDHVVIDNNGIGYKLYMAETALSGLKTQEEARLFTYLSVREDGWTLYGFLCAEEQNFFEMLLSVAGIGPKAALSILSSLPVTDFCEAVVREDTKTLTRIPGIGQKSAARIVVELKDKVQTMQKHLPRATEKVAAGAFAEALEALLSLGYSSGEARTALFEVQGIDENPQPGSSTMLRLALRRLGTR